MSRDGFYLVKDLFAKGLLFVFLVYFHMQVAFISRGKEVGEMGLIGNFARLRTASMVAHYDCEESTASQ